MKRFLLVVLFILFVSILFGCKNENKLYVLNVGDYIDKELVSAFEEEYNCTVVYTEVNSNEEIYQKLKNENYDICVVSDYMIHRMKKEDLIIDLSGIIEEKIPNYKYDELFSDAKDLMDRDMEDFKDYFVPYFWGTIGILYRLDKEGLEDYILENGLAAIFSNNEYNKGMYNSSRDALSMALLVLGYDINDSSEEALIEAKELIKSVTYRAWGDDNLKAMVHNGTLDMAMVYSGDYYDEAYQCEVDDEEIDFGFIAPDVTNIWADGLVVTKKANNKELAFKFINYLSDFDNQLQNADYIGYTPLNEGVFNALCDMWEYDEDDRREFYPYGPRRDSYQFISVKHYNDLNDYLEEAKSK